MTGNNIKKDISIAILGGTGKEGKGLGYRWLKAGYRLFIGSRNIEKAKSAADDLRMLFDDADSICVEGLENPEAATKGDIVVLTVPYSAHQAMLESVKSYLTGKILIDVTVPLVPPKVTKVQMPPAGSASLEAKQIVGDDVSVVSAFQNISYEHLLSDEELECDVLVCGDKKESREQVLTLAQDAGMVGWDAGVLENSIIPEGLTSILIGINKKYGTTSAGIRITGVPRLD